MKLICISLREKHIKSSLWEIFCIFPSTTTQQVLPPKAKMQIAIPQPEFTGET